MPIVPDPPNQFGSPFHGTSWTLVSRARGDDPAARQATEMLCRLYWQPLYVYIRRAGREAHEAEDVVQGFFAHIVEHDLIARADSSRGRFRTFLLAGLQQFLARRHRDESRLKRAPGSKIQSLDVEQGERAVAHSFRDLTPDRAFDRAWAMSQLEMAWNEVEREFAATGRDALYQSLRRMLSGRMGSAKVFAAELGMSEGAFNVAAHRLRRQYGEALRRQVAQTLETPEEIDDEIARLRAALGGGSV